MTIYLDHPSLGKIVDNRVLSTDHIHSLCAFSLLGNFLHLAIDFTRNRSSSNLRLVLAFGPRFPWNILDLPKKLVASGSTDRDCLQIYLS
jgi:hypothetical protein